MGVETRPEQDEHGTKSVFSDGSKIHVFPSLVKTTCNPTWYQQSVCPIARSLMGRGFQASYAFWGFPGASFREISNQIRGRGAINFIEDKMLNCRPCKKSSIFRLPAWCWIWTASNRISTR